jgi:hypothetical protein
MRKMLPLLAPVVLACADQVTTPEAAAPRPLLDAVSANSAEPLRAMARKFVQVWDCTRMRAGLALIDAHFADDFVDHNYLIGPTREDYKVELRTFCAIFPDLVAVPELIQARAGSDLVDLTWTARATYAGGLAAYGVNDATAVGRTITLQGSDLIRVAKGKIVERWGVFDFAGMLAQLTSP